MSKIVFNPHDHKTAYKIAMHIGKNPTATHKDVAIMSKISVPAVNKNLFDGALMILANCNIHPEDNTYQIIKKVETHNVKCLIPQDRYDLDMVMCLFHKLMYSRSINRRNRAKDILRELSDHTT